MKQQMNLHMQKMNSTLESWNSDMKQDHKQSNYYQGNQQHMNQNRISQSLMEQLSQIAHPQDQKAQGSQNKALFTHSYEIDEGNEAQLGFQMLDSIILEEDERKDQHMMEDKQGGKQSQRKESLKEEFLEFLQEKTQTQIYKQIKADMPESSSLNKPIAYSEKPYNSQKYEKIQCQAKDYKQVQASNKENMQHMPKNVDVKEKRLRTQGIIKKPTHSYKSNEDSFILEQKIPEPEKKMTYKKVGFTAAQMNVSIATKTDKQQGQSRKNIGQNSKRHDTNTESLTSKTSIKLQKSSRSINMGTMKSSLNLYRQKMSTNYICKVKNVNGGQMIYKEIPIHSEAQELKEIQIFNLTQKLSHRNLIKTYSITKEISVSTNKPTLVSLIDYHPFSLKQYIDENSLTTSLKNKVVLFQVIKALNYLHQNNIYHRDISANTILINQSLEVVLASFSSIYHAKLHYKDYKYCRTIRPPEIVLNSSYEYGSSGDIWQLGCLIIYIITKKIPFQEYSDSNLMLEIIKLIGLPESEDLKAINFTNHRRFTFPSLHRQSLRKALKCEDLKMIRLLERIMVYNPGKRASAVDLLKDQYFDQIRCQKNYLSLKKQGCKMQNLFDFQENEIDQNDRMQIVPRWYDKQ